jgi:branched-chain amino acid aminotransferase
MSVQFKIHRNPHPVSKVERAALLANPGFRRVFSDHMGPIRYADGKGWHDVRVEPRAPIPMDPATAVLHYAQEIFEGLKACLAADGGVTMFRPQANAARFRASAARMAMAELPEDLFIGSLRELVSIDRDWIPTGEDGSLYLRPFMYASEVFLGVRPSAEFPVRGHRLPGRLVLQGRGHPGRCLDITGVHPGGAWRYRCRKVRRKLRRQPTGPGPGH